MKWIKQYKKLPHAIQLLLCIVLLFCLVGFANHIYITYNVSEILAVTSYTFLIVSMTQHDIVKLRLFGACAGTCFVIQFALSDLPIINVIGQGGLVIYGIYQAIQESKTKKKVV